MKVYVGIVVVLLATLTSEVHGKPLTVLDDVDVYEEFDPFRDVDEAGRDMKLKNYDSVVRYME